MNNSYINRDALVKAVAEKTGFTQVQVKEIIDNLESDIVDFLKKRGRVIIRGFGSFYTYKRKSQTIKQIKSKKKRLIVSQKSLKFKASGSFKDKIKRHEDKNEVEESQRKSPEPKTKIKIQTDRPRAQAQNLDPNPRRSYNPPAYDLKPVAQYPKITRDQFHKVLKDRLAASAQSIEKVNSSSTKIEQTPEGKLVMSLIKIASKNKKNKINFILDRGLAQAYTLKPKKKIGQLPYTLCRKFFEDFLELHDLDIPQHRHKLVEYKSNNRGIIMLTAHSIPTSHGSSIVLEFK